MSTPPDRPYPEIARRLGIKGAGDFQVGRQVVPVVQVDELGGLVAPIDRSVSFGSDIVAAGGAGTYTQMEFHPGGEGFYLLYLSTSALAYFWIDAVATGVAAVTPMNQMRFGGHDPETFAYDGAHVGVSAPGGAFIVNAAAVPALILEPTIEPFYVPRGRLLHVEAFLANTAMRVSWGFREVPRQGQISDW